MNIENIDEKAINDNIELAMKNARASIAMEGLTVTPQMDELCRKFLQGEYSVDECINIFMSAEKGVNTHNVIQS